MQYVSWLAIILANILKGGRNWNIIHLIIRRSLAKMEKTAPKEKTVLIIIFRKKKG